MTEARVLITGASGFLGRQICAALQRRGVMDLHGISRQPAPAVPGVRWHQLDLLQADSRELVDQLRPTHLIHSAWCVKPGDYWHAPENEEWAQASAALLQGFGEAGGARALTIGSCAEYDWSSLPCVEDCPAEKPATRYGRAKRAMHVSAERIANDLQFSHAHARMFFTFGPHEHEDRIVPRITRSLLASQPIVLEHPADSRDFLSIIDVGDALAATLLSELRGAVNIASGQPTTIKSLAATISGIIGRPELVSFHDDTANASAAVLADTRRLTTEVGWRLPRNLDERLAETVEWWKHQNGPAQPR